MSQLEENAPAGTEDGKVIENDLSSDLPSDPSVLEALRPKPQRASISLSVHKAAGDLLMSGAIGSKATTLSPSDNNHRSKEASRKAANHNEPKHAKPKDSKPKSTSRLASLLQASMPNVRSTGNSKPPPLSTQARAQETDTIQPPTGRLERLMRVEWTSVHDKVLEVDEFKALEGAEAKFEIFESFMDSEANNLGLPKGCMPYERVIIQRPGSKATPYVRFSGFSNEGMVKKYHSILMKREVRQQYYPPLRICYEIQRSPITPLAANTNAYLFGDHPPGTLCGSLARIGTASENRMVTIGGVISIGKELWALTSGHRPYEPLSRDAVAPNYEPGTLMDTESVDEEAYGDDIDPILIMSSQKRVVKTHDRPSTPTIAPETPNYPKLGESFAHGEEWSLLSIGDNFHQPILPNFLETDDGSAMIHLTREAERPEHAEVLVLAGASGQQTMTMSPGSVRYPLATGQCVPAWKLTYNSPYSLRRGDSGSWVVSASSGVVYGQIISSSIDYAYLLPLKTTFAQIQERWKSRGHSVQVSLPQSFDILADLAQTCYARGARFAASKHAMKALQEPVLIASTKSDAARIMMQVLKSFSSEKQETEKVKLHRILLSATLATTGADLHSFLSRRHASAELIDRLASVSLDEKEIRNIVHRLEITAANNLKGISPQSFSPDTLPKPHSDPKVHRTPTFTSQNYSHNKAKDWAVQAALTPRDDEIIRAAPAPSKLQAEVPKAGFEIKASSPEIRTISEKFGSPGEPTGVPLRGGADHEYLMVFRRAIGINSDRSKGHRLLESGHTEPTGMYKSVLQHKAKEQRKHLVLWWALNFIGFTLVAIGAILTGLGGASEDGTGKGKFSVAIATLSGLSIPFAAILWVAVGQGRLERYHQKSLKFVRVQEWIEETEALIMVGVIGRNRQDLGRLVEVAFKKYNSALAQDYDLDPGAGHND